jgi:hypothetical protein
MCLMYYCALPNRGALPRVYLFADSQISGARQRLALGKTSFAESSTLGTNRTSAKPQPRKRPTYARHLCREPAVSLSAKYFSLPRASAKALGKIFFFEFLLPIFLCSLATVIEAKIWNLVYFPSLLLYFVYFFHFLDFFHKTHIWTAGAWNNESQQLNKWYSFFRGYFDTISRDRRENSTISYTWHGDQVVWDLILNYIKCEWSRKIMKIDGRP